MSVTEIEIMMTPVSCSNNRIHQGEKKSEPFKADRADPKRDPWTQLKVCNGALNPQEPAVCLRWPLLDSQVTIVQPQLNKDCAHADLLHSPFCSWEGTFVRSVLK